MRLPLISYNFPIGARVEISSDSTKFLTYVKKYFGGFNDAGVSIGEPEVVIKSELLFFPKRERWIPRQEETNMVSRRILRSDSQLYVNTEHSKIYLSLKGSAYIELSIFSHRRTGLRELVKYAIKSIVLRHNRPDKKHFFQKLLRQAVHIPLLSNYLNRGCLIGHGFAFVKEKTAIVIFGGGGMGKSTVGYSMMQELDDGVLISDNYIILYKSDIIRFPEPYRFENTLGIKERRKNYTDTFHVKSRTYFVLERNDTYQYPISKLILIRLERGGTYKCERLSASSAIRDFVACTLTLGEEFPFGTYMGYLGYLGDNQFIPVLNTSDLEIEKIEAYTISFPECETGHAFSAFARQLLDEVFK